MEMDLLTEECRLLHRDEFLQEVRVLSNEIASTTF